MKFKVLKIAITGILLFIGSLVNVANAGLIEVIVNDNTNIYTVADGVDLVWHHEGTSYLTGGKVYSPSGAPDLFYQQGDVAAFTGVLSTLVEYALELGFPGDGDWLGWNGARNGTDNWMKIVSDGGGEVTWTQFEFNFASGTPAGTNINVIRYISDTTGRDFTLSEATSFNANAVPEPSTLAIFALGMIGLASRRFKK